MARVYCPKCNLIVQQDEAVGAAALNCPKCGSSNLVPIVSKGSEQTADYNSAGIYRAAAEEEAKAKERALQEYKSEGIYSTALSFFESLKGKPKEGGEPEAAIPTENPFIVTTAQCPVCENHAEQRSFKSHVFFTKDKDFDMRPTTYGWHNPSFGKLHPPLYYMWHCPRCHYTASQTVFKAPETNTSLTHKRMAERLVAALYDPANAAVVQELTEGLNPREARLPHGLQNAPAGDFPHGARRGSPRPGLPGPGAVPDAPGLAVPRPGGLASGAPVRHQATGGSGRQAVPALANPADRRDDGH